MAIAAVPSYLGNDFSSASPAMRFGMYLQLWGVNRRSQDILWTTHDINYERRGQGRQERELKIENKVSALNAATALTEGDKEVMQALLKRQGQAFTAIKSDQGLMLEAIAVAPFSTGLGNDHPLENGFAFLNPYGLPYLPGSGVKGVLRQAARELSSGEWGDAFGWDDDAITALFGRETVDTDTEQLRGALSFWDVIPQINGDSLAVEIMTPHQKHYYQDGQSPHDSGSPTPITFLSVPAGADFVFHVQCNTALLQRSAPDLLQNNQWQSLLQAAFEHAFAWLGFGAKTAVGYGAMMEDETKKAERERLQKEQEEEMRRSKLSPEDIAYEDNRSVIQEFNDAFTRAKEKSYQPGQEFDSYRNTFVEVVSEWKEQRSRLEAADLLEQSIQWGASKRGKSRLKSVVDSLRSS